MFNYRNLVVCLISFDIVLIFYILQTVFTQNFNPYIKVVGAQLLNTMPVRTVRCAAAQMHITILKTFPYLHA
jgi:hypothetical protein